MSGVMQTLFHLHLNAALCHLDLTPGNLMLAHRYNPYDTLRVIDLGFAKRFNPGEHADSDLGLAAKSITSCRCAGCLPVISQRAVFMVHGLAEGSVLCLVENNRL